MTQLIPAAAVGPHLGALSFGLERFRVLSEYKLFEIPLWQYAASVLYVVLAYYVAKLLEHVVRVELKQWAARTRTVVDDVIVELLHGPIKVVAFVIFLHLGLRLIPWPDWVDDFSSKALKIVVACSLTYMALKLVDITTAVWKRRSTAVDDAVFNEQLLPVVRNSLKAFVTIIAILVTSQNLGLNISSLIASLSIGGLALGLAAQDTLGNLFGAVSVFVDKPFRVGDLIRLDTVEGRVEAIGLRSTRIRNPEGHLITVPNKTMGNAIITNITLRPNIKTTLNIGIPYDTPLPKVRRAAEILEAVYRDHPLTVEVWVSLNKFLDSALNLQVVHWWQPTDPKTHLAGMHVLNLKVKERFDAEGIDFAFPTQTLYLRSEAAAAAGAVAGEAPARPAPTLPPLI